MSVVFEVMYEWSKSLENDHIDEDHQEIQVPSGRNRNTVLNNIVRVRGRRGGVGVVVSWEDYFATSSFKSLNPTYTRHVLDVFVADKSVRFEGFARPRTFSDKLLGLVGLRRGLQPMRHSLFAECLVQPENAEADASELANRAYCQALLDLLRQPGVLKSEFQADAGLSVLLRVAPKALSTTLLDRIVDATANTLAARSAPSGT